MELYYGRFSGNSARAVLGLEEAGARWEPRVLDIHHKENRAPAYLGINPMGKIPALVDGALVLWESNAINWYAAEKNPQARLIPQSVEGRASLQRWLFFQAGHVTPACIPVFRNTNARIQAFWKVTPDPQALEHGRAELKRYLPVLDEALAGREWLLGDFSLADVAYAPHLVAVADGGYDFGAVPRVGAWVERLRARPAWQKTAARVFAD